MRILALRQSGTQYTSNVYLVLGTWNRLTDINTLVDVGRDPYVLGQIRSAPTGVGKRKVDRVVLTHGHYDHVELLPAIRDEFGPEVLAHSAATAGVDRAIRDGETVVMGDEEFEVIVIHAHTDDSICLYNPKHGVLFSGDAPILVTSAGGSYEPEFVRAMEGLCSRDIRAIHPGHGSPLLEGCNARLRSSFQLIRGLAQTTRPVAPES